MYISPASQRRVGSEKPIFASCGYGFGVIGIIHAETCVCLSIVSHMRKQVYPSLGRHDKNVWPILAPYKLNCIEPASPDQSYALLPDGQWTTWLDKVEQDAMSAFYSSTKVCLETPSNLQQRIAPIHQT